MPKTLHIPNIFVAFLIKILYTYLIKILYTYIYISRITYSYSYNNRKINFICNMLMTFQTFQNSIGNNHRGVILKPLYKI